MTRILEYPQRKIKKSYRSVTGYFPSIKNDRLVAFESLLERGLFLTLEFDTTVSSYIEQVQIEIERASKKITYSSDCLIKHLPHSGIKDSIIEAKYVSELKSDEEKLIPKFDAIKKSATELDMVFNLFTDETYPPVYLENLDFLYRYKTHQVQDNRENEILSALSHSMSVKALIKKMSPSKQEYMHLANAIWSLVASNVLVADLKVEPVSMQTIIQKSAA